MLIRAFFIFLLSCLPSVVLAAITGNANLGTCVSSSASTTCAFTPSFTLEAGNVGVLAIGMDNTGTGDGNDSEVCSIADSVSNVYTYLRSFRNGQGAAAAGAVIEFWQTKATTNLTTSHTVTITFCNTVTEKGALFREFIVGAGKVLRIATGGVGFLDQAQDGATAPASMALSSLTNKEYVFVRGFANEAGFASFTPSTSFTSWGRVGSAVFTLIAEARIVTATGQTSAPTYTVGATDWANVMLALEEADPPASGGGTSALMGVGR